MQARGVGTPSLVRVVCTSSDDEIAHLSAFPIVVLYCWHLYSWLYSSAQCFSCRYCWRPTSAAALGHTVTASAVACSGTSVCAITLDASASTEAVASATAVATQAASGSFDQLPGNNFERCIAFSDASQASRNFYTQSNRAIFELRASKKITQNSMLRAQIADAVEHILVARQLLTYLTPRQEVPWYHGVNSGTRIHKVAYGRYVISLCQCCCLCTLEASISSCFYAMRHT